MFSKKFRFFLIPVLLVLLIAPATGYSEAVKSVYPGILPVTGDKSPKARVAIVIDDFGQHNTEGVDDILSLGIPITCAVMPNLEYTNLHAGQAAKKGHQVIVHLPLEPVSGKKSWLGPGAITMDLNKEQITALAKKDFESVPFAVGFNNHMGSAVTTSEKTMRPILQAAKEKEFYVLDSRTNQKTVIPLLSDEIGIPWVQRDVFLDNVKSPAQVKIQLKRTALKALEDGQAVCIGHVGQGGNATAGALKEMLPEMKEMGIDFVYLSEIVSTNTLNRIRLLNNTAAHSR